MSKPIVLVDGSSYLFRAFYALPNLTNNQGQPTGAILGVINMLRRLLNDYDPEYIGVIFDTKGTNFRHELYADYKANRDAMPEDLAAQIEPLHNMIRAMGLPLIAIEGVEADDVIGALVHAPYAKGHEVVISTGDKDIAQLVDERVTLVDTMKGVTLDRAGVKEKFGVWPEQIIDYLSLMGDASDNIPGIPKVGPKTAVKWLDQFETLEAIKENADQIGGKVGENLRAHLDQLGLAKQLTTIKTDLALDVDLEKLKRHEFDTNTLIEQCQTWGFTSWLKFLGEGEVKPAIVVAKPEYETILTPKQWQIWQDKIHKKGIVSIDTETTSLDPLQAKLVGVSFAINKGEAAYLPLAHHYLDVPEQLSFDQTLAELKAILEDSEIKKIGQNLKYDLKVLRNYQIVMKNIYFDTMLASYVLEAGHGRHDLDSMADRHLGVKTIKYEEVAGKGAKQICFSEVPIETAAPYAAEDADIAWQLYVLFEKMFSKEPTLEKLFREEELPILNVLADMECEGVQIDCDELNRQSLQMGNDISNLEKKAFELAGTEFNLSSTKQLQTILFEQMELPVVKKTPKGQPSTNEEVLQELAVDYELPKVLLEYRHLTKLKSTYTDKLPQMINPKTGRVHTSYHQAVAITGRLSSSDPNLQNIPVKSAQGRMIRKAFIAPKDKVIIAADYSQIELRIMAHLSNDKGLVDAFNHNADIHTATASEVFGVPREQVTKEQRRNAKAVNFGLIYGMSAFGLARQLGVERKLAAEYIDTYFARYPGVKAYMESTREKAKENGYVETIFGRRLYLPEINSKNGMRRAGAERAAINAPMQGTAADIIKRAMIGMANSILSGQIDAKMIMQVHDELVFEVAQNLQNEFVSMVTKVMESAADLSVPLSVSVDVGPNWDEAH